MQYEFEDLNNMNTEQLQAVIAEDEAGDGELLFTLEATLKDLVGEMVFPDSETFGDIDAETGPERCIRILIESLDFMTTLSAINALSDDEVLEADS